MTKRRQVPIPRRILALACESSAPALIAVILGVCLRCSWLRPGEGFTFTGRIACSWLARRFGLSLRAIQSAKEHLVGLGWLERTGKVNRCGETVAINPAWHRLVALPEIQNEAPENPGAGEGNFSTEPTPAPLPDPPAGTNSAGFSLTEVSLPAEEFKAAGSNYFTCCSVASGLMVMSDSGRVADRCRRASIGLISDEMGIAQAGVSHHRTGQDSLKGVDFHSPAA